MQRDDVVEWYTATFGLAALVIWGALFLGCGTELPRRGIPDPQTRSRIVTEADEALSDLGLPRVAAISRTVWTEGSRVALDEMPAALACGEIERGAGTFRPMRCDLFVSSERAASSYLHEAAHCALGQRGDPDVEHAHPIWPAVAEAGRAVEEAIQ